MTTRTRRKSKKRSNYTLSSTARWFCKRLQRPLGKDSESAVAELLILNEAERLGLKKPSLPHVQPPQQPQQEAA